MTNNWYLCNGKRVDNNKGVGNVVCLLNESGELRNSFPDIAHLDLCTMKMPYKGSRYLLKEYNEDIDLSGVFYNVKHISKKGGQSSIEVYPTLFDFDSLKNRVPESRQKSFEYFYDCLMFFAKERKDNFDHNKKLDLGYASEESKKKLKVCYETTMVSLMSIYYEKLVLSNSTIPYEIKAEIIKGKEKGTVGELVNNNKFKNFFRTYSTFRNILIEVLYCIANVEIIKNEDLKEVKKWKIPSIKTTSYENYSFLNDDGSWGDVSKFFKSNSNSDGQLSLFNEEDYTKKR